MVYIAIYHSILAHNIDYHYTTNLFEDSSPRATECMIYSAFQGSHMQRLGKADKLSFLRKNCNASERIGA